jgi:hypothetical protein
MFVYLRKVKYSICMKFVRLKMACDERYLFMNSKESPKRGAAAAFLIGQSDTRIPVSLRNQSRTRMKLAQNRSLNNRWRHYWRL